ncbi:hypothetical protein Poli38472_009596 [Pythium oligandrum]|uniref:Uncharacterized protein n=1 Tax=Pythium oligandrum TaxID=41045 RepID=A0A8K1CFJ9_PYTOL|nr:hypothetical protein Poli38472_009596 [Pythium oligandrum]|eukprot:TMW62103.1 hypothetical protein Poli38472_009596 [Pythium oligandrum]
MASSTSGSSSVDGFLRSPNACTYYDVLDTDMCFVPRACAACLEMEGCMVNQFGKCVDAIAADGYSPAMNFRKAQELNLVFPAAADTNASTEQRWQFPALNATYCNISDAVCNECRQKRYWMPRHSGLDARYCMGEAGCICISMCDSPVWEEAIPKQCIPGLQPSHSVKSSGPSVGGILLAILPTALIISGCVYCVRRCRRKKRAKKEEEERDEEPATPVPGTTAQKQETVPYISIKDTKEEVASAQHPTVSDEVASER